MTAAIISDGCEHLAMNNLAPALGLDYYSIFDFDKLWGTPFRPEEGLQPDILFIKGWFVANYEGLTRMYKIMGDQAWKYNDRCKKAEKVVILWAGSDVLAFAGWRGKMGKYEAKIFGDLRGDRFLHIPVAIKQKNELRKLLDIESADPLPTPARKLFDEMPLPEKQRVAVYMPTYNMDMYRYDLCLKVAKVMPDIKFVFYHWMLPVGGKEAVAPSELPNVSYQYACSFDQYKQIIAESSCALRLTRHEGLSGGAADFLLAGRPVFTCHDMPEWPAALDNNDIGNDKVPPEQIAIMLRSYKDGVPRETREWYLDHMDPAKYKERINERLDQKWPGCSI